MNLVFLKPISESKRRANQLLQLGLAAFLIFASGVLIPVAAASLMPPQLWKVKNLLQRVGEVELAQRIWDDYREGIVTVAPLGGEGVRAETGLESGGNHMTLDQTSLEIQIREEAPNDDPNVISWALTVRHEYVHMRQNDPDQVPEFEDPAWHETIATGVRWYRRLAAEFDRVRDQPPSSEKLETLRELRRLISGVAGGLVETYQTLEEGDGEIEAGHVSPGLLWPGIVGKDSADLTSLSRAVQRRRDVDLARIDAEIARTAAAPPAKAAAPTPPLPPPPYDPQMVLSMGALVVPSAVPVRPGVIDNFGGSFAPPGGEFCMPTVKRGPFEVHAAGTIRATINGEPPVPGGMSLSNTNTALRVVYERKRGEGYAVGDELISLRGETTDNHLKGEADIPGPGLITLFIEAPAGSGPLSGRCYTQSYSGRLEMISVSAEVPAYDGMVLQSGDRIRTAGNGQAVMTLPPATRVLLGSGSEMTLHLGSGSGDPAQLDLPHGRVRLIDAGSAGYQLRLGGRVVKPHGTEIMAEQTDTISRLTVIEGAATVTGETGAATDVPAGHQFAWPGNRMSIAASADDGGLVAGIPLRDVILQDGIPEAYQATTAAFTDGAPGNGWIWEDPQKDASFRTPDAGTLQVTVPDGNDFYREQHGAPRLLHRVTGDFDLEGEMMLSSKATDVCTGEFLIKAPGSYLGLLGGQVSGEGDQLHYRVIGGGWVRSKGMDKLGAVNSELYDGPDAPASFVHFRMSRRGDMWKTYWSTDGQRWTLSSRQELKAADTLWAGWVFKRWAWDQAKSETSVVSLRNVRLVSAARNTMNVAPWDIEQWAGQAQLDGHTFHFRLDSPRPAAVTAMSGERVSGDFDVSVEFRTDVPARQNRFGGVGLNAWKDDASLAYVCMIRGESVSPRYATDLRLDGRWGRYQYVETADAAGRLRMVRKGGQVTSFYWSGGDWAPLSRFSDARLEGPLMLTLQLSNEGLASAPTPITADLTLVASASAPAFWASPDTAMIPAPSVTPSNVEALRKEGAALLAAHKYEEALPLFARLIEADPGNEDGWRQRAMAKRELGDLQSAVNDFDRALELNPKSDRAYLGRGLTWQRLNDTARARADFDRGIELNPEYGNGYAYRGLLRLLQKDYRGAVEDLDRAIEHGARDGTNFNNRGWAKQRLQDRAGAKADYEQALALDPGNKLAQQHLARLASPLPGTWNWIDRQTVVFHDDGTAESFRGGVKINDGRWESLGQSQYRVTYEKGGYVDDITLSADGNSIDGVNNQGTRLHGTRMAEGAR